MLLLIHSQARHVEYVSFAGRALYIHTDGLQTCIDRWQLSANHGAHFWAFADFLVPRNAHGLYRYHVFFLDTAWMADAQCAGVHEEKVSH